MDRSPSARADRDDASAILHMLESRLRRHHCGAGVQVNHVIYTHAASSLLRSKNDLGLDHYEGRSWRGFHHHLALSALVYLFILTCWLRSKKNFISNLGADAPLDSATPTETHRLLPILSNHL